MKETLSSRQMQKPQRAIFKADVGRSVHLFKAFRKEQNDTANYYTLLADDTIRQVQHYTNLDGRLVLDIGGGPGFFLQAFNKAGSRAFCVDADAGELSGSGRPARDSILGSALDLPLADRRVDVSFSSNVLEHVPEPERMLDEMVRVTKSGGLVFCAFTNWLSPWGGHETSPWHYAGGERAARIYERRHGNPPKNVYRRSLYPVSIARVLRWAHAQTEADLIDATPRYLPDWTKPLIRIPGAREFLTWNLLLVMRRR
jgi:SAM-dependent methyltransferase